MPEFEEEKRDEVKELEKDLVDTHNEVRRKVEKLRTEVNNLDTGNIDDFIVTLEKSDIDEDKLDELDDHVDEYKEKARDYIEAQMDMAKEGKHLTDREIRLAGEYVNNVETLEDTINKFNQKMSDILGYEKEEMEEEELGLPESFLKDVNSSLNTVETTWDSHRQDVWDRSQKKAEEMIGKKTKGLSTEEKELLRKIRGDREEDKRN